MFRMNHCVLLFILALTAAVVVGDATPSYFNRFPIARRQLDPEQIRRELGCRVSRATSIFGPDDDRYENATSRWNTFSEPRVQVVIVPGKESDVSAVIKYCNQNDIEFLAVNRAHGWPRSLASFNGIQISLSNLRDISIQADGKSAWFGGGTYGGQVTRYLYDQGYVTTTGACDCVGMMGPGLGGGHGRHEGSHGLISDNFLRLNVVLANGSAIKVDKTSHGDLFWAMKGAGHNFGVVTSFEMSIFPRGPDTWHYHNYVWRGDKLEAVFDALNRFHNNGTTPVDMVMNQGIFLMDTSITTREPIISWTFAYRGTAEEAERHLKPFNAIGSVRDDYGDVPYPEISAAQGTDEKAFVCQHGNNRIATTAGLQVYNSTAERQIFEGFKKQLVSNPEIAAASIFLHEGYSTAAAKAQDPKDSAYPFRDDNHLMLALVAVPPNDLGAGNAGREWAEEVRDQWNAGQPGRPANVYVNYASGSEPLHDVFGHEDWRLKRLRQLKAEYDPHNRFGYYNPIDGYKRDFSAV